MSLQMLFLAGCRKKDEAKTVAPSSPKSYMHDEKFIGTLEKKRAQHSELVRARNAIAEKMRQMIEAKKAELKTEDLKAVKAALEKDPAWQSLYSQCTNANAAVERHRCETMGVVRERIAPKGRISEKPISK